MILTYIKETHRTAGLVRQELLCQTHLVELYPTEAERTPHRWDKDGYELHVSARFSTGGNGDSCTHCGLAPEFRGVSK